MFDTSDNLYARSTEYFAPEEPEEQAQEREEHEENIKKELAIMAEVIESFDERILFYKSVDSIPDDITLNPAEHAQTVLANKRTAAALINEKDRLVSLLESLTRR